VIDRDLPPLDRLRAQDHGAFDALVGLYHARIARYLTRLAGDAEVAAELTQDTFLRAYQALPTLADDSDVGAWLYRIATNLARQHHRHGQLLCWQRLEPHHAPSRSMEDDLARRDAVHRALSRLTLDQRICLLLYAWTGYTCAEIGQITGRSTDAVRMLLVRARRRFRAAYGAVTAASAGIDDDRPEPPAALGGPSEADTGDRSGGMGGCGAVRHLLPLYPRGDLPLDDFVSVTRHLAGCAECREALLEVQTTYQLLQAHLNAADLNAPGGVVPLAVPLDRQVVALTRRARHDAIDAPLYVGRQLLDERDGTHVLLDLLPAPRP
jgi:RNA polymerase sigma-70 factor (ECF subfamily)